jgi:hypothetical protein
MFPCFLCECMSSAPPPCLLPVSRTYKVSPLSLLQCYNSQSPVPMVRLRNQYAGPRPTHERRRIIFLRRRQPRRHLHLRLLPRRYHQSSQYQIHRRIFHRSHRLMNCRQRKRDSIRRSCGSIRIPPQCSLHESLVAAASKTTRSQDRSPTSASRRLHRST